MGVIRHAGSIQNKYAIFLQYLKKEMSDEVDFLHADNSQTFQQVDNIFSDRFGLACLKFSDKFAIPLHFRNREVKNILIFVMCTDVLVKIIISVSKVIISIKDQWYNVHVCYLFNCLCPLLKLLWF